MKHVCILSVMLVLAAILPAQNIDKGVTLQEVEVKAAKVIYKADRQIIFPTGSQKESSSSGYSMLQKLALPNIRVNETLHTVSVVDGSGEVQLRINGIIATRDEMQAMDPALITRIDFIDTPGVRYGERIAYVIDIQTKRKDNGYVVGLDFMNSLTTKLGNDLIYGKWNIGKNEISLSYRFGYKDFRKDRRVETADYLLNDGSVRTIRRDDIVSRSRNFSDDFQMKYNLADSASYVFQASLSARFSRIPDNFSHKLITDGADSYMAMQTDNAVSSSPVLDLYFFKRISGTQTFTVNAVGTYISTSFDSSYDEGSPYLYNVEGKTYSLMSEAVYEHRFKPFAFTAGMNYMQKYTSNIYSGDVNSDNPVHNRRAYGFVEIKGGVGAINYSVGLGGSFLDYRQQEHSYRFGLFRPKASVSYCPVPGVQLKYDFQISDHVSQVAMVSNTAIRNNSMEWTLVNPDIRPNREQEHIFQISFTRPRFQSFVQVYGKLCSRPNMATYIRTADDQFIYTQLNQKEIDALNAMLYVNGWIFPDKLSLAASGTLFRCFNFGKDYTHCRTFYMGTASLQAYFGKFSLSALFESGWRFMEGETEGFNGSYIQISASYHYKDLHLSVGWQQPFNNRYRQFQSGVYNRYVRKTTALYCPDLGNFVCVNVSWKFSKGRKFKEVRRTLRQKNDSDTGILH